jgi:hypothetical protein
MLDLWQGPAGPTGPAGPAGRWAYWALGTGPTGPWALGLLGPGHWAYWALGTGPGKTIAACQDNLTASLRTATNIPIAQLQKLCVTETGHNWMRYIFDVTQLLVHSRGQAIQIYFYFNSDCQERTFHLFAALLNPHTQPIQTYHVF